VTSVRYREFSHESPRDAKRYGHDKNVVGWQIDNEYGYAQISYDEESRRHFQDWLKAKYKTLDA